MVCLGEYGEKPSDEYIEKSSPMKFRVISPPIDTVVATVREALSDEPSDETVLEKGSPMNIPEEPSDERIREAVTELLELTACRCGRDWTSRGLHERECLEHYRETLVVLVAAVGMVGTGQRAACATVRSRTGGHRK